MHHFYSLTTCVGEYTTPPPTGTLIQSSNPHTHTHKKGHTIQWASSVNEGRALFKNTPAIWNFPQYIKQSDTITLPTKTGGSNPTK